jgi:hypothetical protein
MQHCISAPRRQPTNPMKAGLLCTSGSYGTKQAAMTIPPASATQASDCDTAPLQVQSAAHAAACEGHASLVHGQQSGVPGDT